MKLGLYRGQIGEDVRMVELEVIQDHGIRPVMDEFCALVEERRIVLVSLDHEALAAAEPRRCSEICGNTADKEAGLEPRQRRTLYEPL